jgi:hypothetical protein
MPKYPLSQKHCDNGCPSSPSFSILLQAEAIRVSYVVVKAISLYATTRVVPVPFINHVSVWSTFLKAFGIVPCAHHQHQLPQQHHLRFVLLVFAWEFD